MIRTLQNILRQDRESFVIPWSVQDAIPIRRVWPDGVFQFGNKFSKTIRFTDINYAIASKEDKTSIVKERAAAAPCASALSDSRAPERAADAFPSQKISDEKGRLPRQRFSAAQPPNANSYPTMRSATVEKAAEAMPDTPVSVSEVPPAKHNTRIPAKMSPVQRYGRPRAQTKQPASPAAAPIRQKIKADAPKIKSSAQAVKQPVRAIERAKAKAILDARKSTAAARTTARTAIVAGGGVALVVVLVICLVALLLATPFGLFLAPEHSDSGSTIQTAITSLNGEFSLVIEQIQENNPHDVLNMDNDGVAAMTENWNDVLAIYAVLITTDETSPGDAATMTPEKLNVLRGVFWDMNRISYDLETVEDIDSGKEETTLTVTISTKNKDEIAAEYDFTSEQLELLDELTQSEYEGLFAALAGRDASLILSPAQMQTIMEQMGGSIDATRQQVVMTAYQLQGKCNYFWGGKSLTLGWDSRWERPRWSRRRAAPPPAPCVPTGSIARASSIGCFTTPQMAHTSSATAAARPCSTVGVPPSLGRRRSPATSPFIPATPMWGSFAAATRPETYRSSTAPTASTTWS